MTTQPTIRIVQRSMHPHSTALQTLTITVAYGEGAEMEATILLRPGAVPNDEGSIRLEVQRLADALATAARTTGGITS